MKILHAVESLDSSYGGPANSVPMLCASLNRNKNIECLLFSLDMEIANNNIIKKYGLKWLKKPLLGPEKIKYSPDLINYIKNIIVENNIDIIHVHNLWNYFSYSCYRAAKELNKKLIFSIRGSMFPWSLSQRKILKKISWNIFQKKALKYCDFIHVTSIEEQKAVMKKLNNIKYANISNGVEFPNYYLDKIEARVKLGLSVENKCILFLSRIHPKKGLDYVFNGLVNVKENVTLLIVGPVTDKNYMKKCNFMIKGLPKNIDVKLISEVSSDDKWLYYYACDFFILPSHTENFGIVIAESLAAKRPVLTTNNTPWSLLNDINAGVCVELTVDNIENNIIKLLSENEDKLSLMGEYGFKYMKENHEWDSIADRMILKYNEAI